MNHANSYMAQTRLILQRVEFFVVVQPTVTPSSAYEAPGSSETLITTCKTDSMEQSPYWESKRSSVSQEIPSIYGIRKFVIVFTTSFFNFMLKIEHFTRWHGNKCYKMDTVEPNASSLTIDHIRVLQQCEMFYSWTAVLRWTHCCPSLTTL
jgi:hypothetical protein